MTLKNPKSKELLDFFKQITRRTWSLEGSKDWFDIEAEWDISDQWEHMSADDWQNFKKTFVDEYGGSKVGTDGLSHKEFLEYMKSGYRENCEFSYGWEKDADGNWVYDDNIWS